MTTKEQRIKELLENHDAGGIIYQTPDDLQRISAEFTTEVEAYDGFVVVHEMNNKTLFSTEQVENLEVYNYEE